MNRRKFLLGSVGVAALGGLGKLAPAPVSGIPYMSTVEGLLEEGWTLRSGYIVYNSADVLPIHFSGFEPRWSR